MLALFSAGYLVAFFKNKYNEIESMVPATKMFAPISHFK